MTALQFVLPAVDPNLFSEENLEETSIVFADHVEFSKEQLAALGLKE